MGLPLIKQAKARQVLSGTSNAGQVRLIHQSQHMKHRGKIRKLPQMMVQIKHRVFISVSWVPVQLIVAYRSVLVSVGFKDSSLVCRLMAFPENMKVLLKMAPPPAMPIMGMPPMPIPMPMPMFMFMFWLLYCCPYILKDNKIPNNSVVSSAVNLQRPKLLRNVGLPMIMLAFIDYGTPRTCRSCTHNCSEYPQLASGRCRKFSQGFHSTSSFWHSAHAHKGICSYDTPRISDTGRSCRGCSSISLLMISSISVCTCHTSTGSAATSTTKRTGGGGSSGTASKSPQTQLGLT